MNQLFVYIYPLSLRSAFDSECLGPIVYVLNRSVMSDSLQPVGLWSARLLCPWDFSCKNTGVDSHFLLQEVFPTQEWSPSLLCLLHCRCVLYLLSRWCLPLGHQMAAFWSSLTPWMMIGAQFTLEAVCLECDKPGPSNVLLCYGVAQ